MLQVALNKTLIGNVSLKSNKIRLAIKLKCKISLSFKFIKYSTKFSTNAFDTGLTIQFTVYTFMCLIVIIYLKLFLALKRYNLLNCFMFYWRLFAKNQMISQCCASFIHASSIFRMLCDATRVMWHK